MTALDAAAAWQLLLAVRAQAPIRAQRYGAVVVATEGAWHADCPVSQDAAQLLDLLLPLACARGAIVIAQMGQSLDGRIATVSGDSNYVTGKASRVHLHRLRALVDAVVVGVSTVVTDDPALTVRHVPGHNPVRVVLDPHGRAPAAARVFTDGSAPTWQAVAPGVMVRPGAQRLTLPAGDALETAHRLLRALAAHGLRRVLIEGGGVTVSHFVAARLVDRFYLTVAPLLLGSGRSALVLPEIATLAQALRPRCRSFALGDDRVYDLDLRHGAVDAG